MHTSMKKNSNRKTRYNPQRSSYLSEDGNVYFYKVWDFENNRMKTERIEIEKDRVSQEWLLFLDELDGENDRIERNERESRDPLAAALMDELDDSYSSHGNYEKAANPWDQQPDASFEPEAILFSEDEAENPKVEIIRQIIENDFTDAQKDFFYDHFGMKLQLEEMRQAEAKETGRLPSAAAMTNRKNKIIDKTAKVFGAQRVKRHDYPKCKSSS